MILKGVVKGQYSTFSISGCSIEFKRKGQVCMVVTFSALYGE
jgi:hypothetical protein